MKKYGLFLLVTLITFCIRANNLRQINNHDGLSNSSISCLYQDSERFLWIGTYDGLNMYDSRDIYIYKPNINEPYSLSSNVIRNIIETENAYLWVSTKNGINKLSKRSKQVELMASDIETAAIADVPVQIRKRLREIGIERSLEYVVLLHILAELVVSDIVGSGIDPVGMEQGLAVHSPEILENSPEIAAGRKSHSEEILRTFLGADIHMRT